MGVDGDCSGDPQEFHEIEAAPAFFIFRDERLGLAEALCQLCLR
jgi:hypothetical protein